MIPNDSHSSQSESEFKITMDDDCGVDDGPIAASSARLIDDELEIESATRTGQAKLSRKRTKTGCLTCRRRRIKCGEERPTCGNCVKSKRQCEGYNQRVIFKDPLSTTYRAQSSNTQNNTFSGARGASKVPSASQQSHFRTANRSPKTSLPNITENQNSSSQGPGPVENFPFAGLSEQSGESGGRRIYDLPPFQGGYTGTDSEASRYNSLADVNHTTAETGYPPKSPKVLEKQAPRAHYDFSILSTNNSKSGPTADKTTHLDRPGSSSCVPKSPLQDLVYHSDIREAASAILTQSYQGSAEWPLFTRLNPVPPISSSHFQSRSSSMAPDHIMPRGAEERSWGGEHRAEKTSREIPQYQDEQGPASDERIAQEALSSSEVQPQHPKPLGFEDQHPLVNSSLENQNVETPCCLAKDLSDKSDDEMRLDESDRDTLPDFAEVQEDHLKTNDLGIVVALQASQDMQEPRLRTYHSYLGGPDILTSYQPSARSSPLTDSTTARIFYHYVNVTGPSISIYERHPANPSLMFQGRPIPRSQQHIWAYTMPTLALNNQALLHAMLAIGSLHVALLQDGPRMPTLKHYHIAIRRVAKSVRLPLRRGQPAILAATLLLGWYELMSGEHQKWSSHLLGATQLLKEIDFAGITTYLKNRKIQQRQQRYGTLYHHEMALGRFEGQYEKQVESSEAPKQDDLNEGLVGMITGKKLRYDEYGHVMEDFDTSGNRQKVYSQRELETYETQRDLFWWYCKQDAFQSILSGNRLFLPYDWWSHCPPRAAVGKRDATYGTFDHLILLLGRLAEFAAKDLKRKKIALQSNGGQWRPPSITPTQPGPEGQNAARQFRPPQMPSFVGMMPGTEGKAELPRGFSPPREDSPASDDDNPSLEDWTLKAEEEWHEIHTAFNILGENFGPDFQPLGPEHCQPIESPFGPALQYRTYSIAGIWIVYYMGLILCHRYHPTMPPAATMAAGIAARQTGSFANEIGRISAAIAPHSSQMAQVSTGVGAGLIECTFGLFIAGVQYQNPAQRSWLVQRCFDTIRLTGWQTAGAVAMGCESAWTKTAELGHGPPYKRVTEKKIDQEAWYNTRRAADPLSPGARYREKIFIARTDRVHYALGLLGVEQSLEDLDFNDHSKAAL